MKLLVKLTVMACFIIKELYNNNKTRKQMD